MINSYAWKELWTETHRKLADFHMLTVVGEKAESHIPVCQFLV